MLTWQCEKCKRRVHTPMNLFSMDLCLKVFGTVCTGNVVPLLTPRVTGERSEPYILAAPFNRKSWNP